MRFLFATFNVSSVRFCRRIWQTNSIKLFIHRSSRFCWTNLTRSQNSSNWLSSSLELIHIGMRNHKQAGIRSLLLMCGPVIGNAFFFLFYHRHIFGQHQYFLHCSNVEITKMMYERMKEIKNTIRMNLQRDCDHKLCCSLCFSSLFYAVK